MNKFKNYNFGKNDINNIDISEINLIEKQIAIK